MKSLLTSLALIACAGAQLNAQALVSAPGKVQLSGTDGIVVQGKEGDTLAAGTTVEAVKKEAILALPQGRIFLAPKSSVMLVADGVVATAGKCSFSANPDAAIKVTVNNQNLEIHGSASLQFQDDGSARLVVTSGYAQYKLADGSDASIPTGRGKTFGL